MRLATPNDMSSIFPRMSPIRWHHDCNIVWPLLLIICRILWNSCIISFWRKNLPIGRGKHLRHLEYSTKPNCLSGEGSMTWGQSYPLWNTWMPLTRLKNRRRKKKSCALPLSYGKIQFLVSINAIFPLAFGLFFLVFYFPIILSLFLFTMVMKD